MIHGSMIWNFVNSMPQVNRGIALLFSIELGPRFDEKIYYYTYEWGGFIADVGGYMGLLLGHSAISFYDGLKRFWKNKGKKWVIDHK